MEEKITKQINLRVPATLNKRLEAVARSEHNHVSAVTRRLLSKALDAEEAAGAPSPKEAA